MGGPHPTLCPEEILQDENVDFVVIGEGEISFYELVTSLTQNKSLEKIESIKGIGFKNIHGELVINHDNTLVKDLDLLPILDRSIFNTYKYASRAMTAMATRGCFIFVQIVNLHLIQFVVNIG